MIVTLIPLMGPLHFKYPAYNAVTVLDTIKAFKPDVLAITALKAGSLSDPLWQDTPEIVLPLSVIPWAQQTGVTTELVFEPSPDDSAPEDFRRYAQQYPQLRTKVQQADALLRPLSNKLQEALTLSRVLNEALPLLQEQQQYCAQTLEEGPATNWLQQRVYTMAARIKNLPQERVAVLASLDHLPYLQEALQDLNPQTPPTVTANDQSRERSFLDFAFMADVPEPGNVIAKLRDINKAEARYHEANILLMHGHIPEALELLDVLSQGDFSSPYFLPGYVLARLGQVRDLVGDRQGALRAYRGVRALSFAPLEARQAAAEGLETPFGEAVSE